MDAITLLKDDHQTVEQLFKRFEKAGDRAHVAKREIVDRLPRRWPSTPRSKSSSSIPSCGPRFPVPRP
jgi:hypothetical protein